MKHGDKLKYIGRGFLGYDPKEPHMKFLKKDETHSSDLWVLYLGREMLVQAHEVEPVSS